MRKCDAGIGIELFLHKAARFEGNSSAATCGMLKSWTTLKSIAYGKPSVALSPVRRISKSIGWRCSKCTWRRRRLGIPEYRSRQGNHRPGILPVVPERRPWMPTESGPGIPRLAGSGSAVGRKGGSDFSQRVVEPVASHDSLRSGCCLGAAARLRECRRHGY
jgi:hypothetical protein